MEELNAIYERMRAIFAEEAGFVPNDGCDAMVRLYALASEVQSLLAQADWVLDQSFPQTAVGQYLDYHAETRALARLPAARRRRLQRAKRMWMCRRAPWRRGRAATPSRARSI